ncbi:MAG: PAS domain S-box protein [Proteobacteria bacterium]|nr:PAS domain S-box protein [Pseudomonadota bacterium]
MQDSLLEQLFQNSGIGITVTDADGRFVRVNPEVEKFLGYSADELLKLSVFDITHPDDLDRTLEARQKIISRGLPVIAIEKRFVTKGGWIKWALLTLSRLEDEHSGDALFSRQIQDIDARKATEHALQESEQRFRKIFQSSPAMVSISDVTSATIYDVNENWLRVLGYQRDEVIGRTPYDLDILTRPAIRDEATSRADDRPITGVETQYRAKNGDLMDIVVGGDVIEYDGKKCILFVSQDITEEKQREGQLRQSQRLEALGQLTGGVAHDFNNLMAALLGNLEMIKNGLTDAPELVERVERSAQIIKRGSSLTSRLLAYSRRQSLHPVRTNLNMLLVEWLDTLDRSLGEAVEVHLDMQPGLWETYLDQNQLETALINLAVNARDAMPDGGRLTIGCKNATLSDHDILDDPNFGPGDYVCISVTDTGLGIPVAHLQNVFEPFFTTKAVGEGSGLGLSMVFGFVKQSGGQIVLRSEENVGTQVNIYFPRDRNTEVRPPKPPEADSEPIIPVGSGETVLVVEDDENVREATIDMLERLGYVVVDGVDGALCLKDHSRFDNIDLLLTDVILPEGRSGPVIAASANARNPSLKVVMMTGYAEASLLLGDSGKGVYPLLNKPFNLETLANTVFDALQKSPRI